MKYILLPVAVFGLLLGCEAENMVDPDLPAPEAPLKVFQFTTPLADSAFIYFSFDKGDTVNIANPANSLEWDVGFKRTTIVVNSGTSGPGNGGAGWLEGVNFEDVTTVPEGFEFAIDDTNNTSGSSLAIPTGSGNGWYTYTGPPNHWILAIEDRVFLFRTADEKYAKVKFISYYASGEPPTEPLQADSRYYTFKYVYQPDGSTRFQ